MDLAADASGVSAIPLHHMDAFGRTAKALPPACDWARCPRRGSLHPAVRELRELVGYRAEHH